MCVCGVYVSVCECVTHGVEGQQQVEDAPAGVCVERVTEQGVVCVCDVDGGAVYRSELERQDI